MQRKKKDKANSSPRRPWLSWRPTSSSLLAHAERKMLDVGIGKGKYEQYMVDVGDGNQINTLIAGRGQPLVIMHGFASGLGLFVCNIKELSQHYKVYALDMIGFGRSSRPKTRIKTPEQAEDFFLHYFETWRSALQLTRFTLIGHSLGGYLSSLYTIRNPQHIEHLILADVWGILPRPEDEGEETAAKWRLIKTSLTHLNPLAPLRFAGPFGPNIMYKLRPDMMHKFAHLFEHDAAKEIEMVNMQQQQKPPQQGDTDTRKRREREDDENNENEAATEEAENQWEMVEEGMMQEEAVNGLGKQADISARVVIDYIYHINARLPATGEHAFRKLLIPINWPARPLCERFKAIDPTIPLTFLFGTHSWIDPTGMFMLQETLPNDVDVIPIHNSGHHLYVDNIPDFNGAILTSMMQQQEKRAGGDALRPSEQTTLQQTLSQEELELVREIDEFVEVGRG